MAWIILQVVNDLRDSLSLPSWVSPVAVILIGIGLVAVLATAWVQSHPTLEVRQQTEELPGAWEVGLIDLKDSIAKGEVPHLTWGRCLMGGAMAFLLLFGFANLDGVGGLRSVDSRTVLARWREAVQGTDAPDLETTLAVGANR